MNENQLYMNPETGSVDTLDGWYPYTESDGLIAVKLDENNTYVRA